MRPAVQLWTMNSMEEIARACCKPDRFVRRRRQLAEAAVLPEGKCDQRRRKAGGERKQGAPPHEEKKERRNCKENRVRRLDRDRPTDGKAGRHGSVPPCRLCGAQAKVRADQKRDHRREVGDRSQAEKLRQSQFCVLLVIPGLDEEDPEVWQRYPQGRCKVCEETPGDAGGNPVYGEQRERKQDQRIAEHDGRKRGNEIRARYPRDG